MMITALIVISLACEALSLTLNARKTDAANLRYGSGSSPRPTSGPMQIKPGLKRAGELFKRSSNTAFQTCGFIDRDPGDPVTCGAGYACAWFYSGYDSLTQGILQCCTTTGTSIAYESCDPGSTCVDYYPRYNTGAEAILESGTWYCGSIGQTCGTYVFEGGRSYWSRSSIAAETYTALYCGDYDTRQFVYQGYTGIISSSSSSSSPSSVPPSSSSTTLSRFSRAATTSSQSAASSSPTGSSGSSSSSNTGAIAGATVGGVVGLAAIAATVGYLVWRKKRQSIPPSREISTYGGDYY